MAGKQEYIYQVLRNDIHRERLAPGEQLPGGLALAKRFDVAHLTVRRALNRMQEDGLIEIREGVGAFVKPISHMKRVILLVDYITDMHAIYPRPMQMMLAKAGYAITALDSRMVMRSPRLLLDQFSAESDYLLVDADEDLDWSLIDQAPPTVKKVFFHRYESDRDPNGSSRILSDYEAAGYAAAQSLWAAGAEDIAFLGNETVSPFHSYYDMERGAKWALAEHGASLKKSFHHDPLSPAELRDLLFGKHKCTGFIGGRDCLLLPLVKLADESGVKIQAVGRANTPFASQYHLSSLDCQAETIALEVHKAMTRDTPIDIKVKPQMIYRASCPEKK